jgi:hypothetical protein
METARDIREEIILREKEIEDVSNKIEKIREEKENLELEKKKLVEEKDKHINNKGSSNKFEDEIDIPDSELKIEEIIKFRPKDTNEGLKEIERNLEEIKELLNQNDSKKISVNIINYSYYRTNISFFYLFTKINFQRFFIFMKFSYKF